jgi:hypothetical protein
LHYDIDNENVEVVNNLNSTNISINEKNNNGWIPLRLATKIVKFLIYYLDLPLTDNECRTALDLATDKIKQVIEDYIKIIISKEPNH